LHRAPKNFVGLCFALLLVSTPGHDATLFAQDSIANTPQGFQQQYHAIFDAYREHRDKAAQERLDTFAIPTHWFADTFGPEHADELARQYAQEFAEFKRRTLANFGGIDAIKARMQIDPSVPTDIRTRRWTPAEDTASQRPPGLRAPLPPAQKFAVDYVLSAPGQGARLTSWIDSYVYIDGAFRFFSRLNKPFWKSGP
jgi:hypothetical protein